MQFTGQLRKLKAKLGEPVAYSLPICLATGDDLLIELNEWIGENIEIHADGQIFCIHCGRKTNKSFSQGSCYPCFKKLACNDMCILYPEKCHHHLGSCREPSWGETHCMQSHIVYLAQTSSLKVGITRATQIPTRWIDQGAIQAMPIIRVNSRLQSGFVEVLFKEHVNDKTNWRAMLKEHQDPMSLSKEWERLKNNVSSKLAELQAAVGINQIEILGDQLPTLIKYPMHQSATATIKSISLDKTPNIADRLLGIKGQYLLFNSGVLNIRKHAGYHVSISKN